MNFPRFQVLKWLLLVSEDIRNPHCMFQKDDAPIHTSNSTFEWFLSNGVHIIEWSALTSDLNSIESYGELS